ncbi:histone deacetylase complex subunit SAP18 [Agelaius phoeniceus]|uniref:histone deacetylase complex subunit SAP18 n=1 Tax=Agelaius phoeniceus TaxID=39638 RepID=UPI004054D0C3
MSVWGEKNVGVTRNPYPEGRNEALLNSQSNWYGALSAKKDTRKPREVFAIVCERRAAQFVPPADPRLPEGRAAPGASHLGEEPRRGRPRPCSREMGGARGDIRERRGKMAVESRVTQEEIKKEPEKPIDREKTCPLLLRVFTTNNGRHHRMDEFSRGNVPSSELQIYTWMDATLKELTSLVKEVYPEARKKGTHFNFAIVFTDLKRPGYRVKEIGSTMSGRKGTDDSMTLQSQKFQIGDYLDIAITPPNRAPPPSSRMRPY